jgi:hypothetical protein
MQHLSHSLAHHYSVATAGAAAENKSHVQQLSGGAVNNISLAGIGAASNRDLRLHSSILTLYAARLS